MKQFRKTLLCLLLVVLLAAAALTGCEQDSNDATEVLTTESAGTASASVPESAPADTAPVGAEPQELGEGDKLLYFDVTFSDGKTNAYVIHTDAETVGEALTALNLIAGDPGEYGLYVKTVDGQTLDYNADGMYWAFYVNGEYAQNGVDQTDIVEGAHYAFIAEKG